MLSLIALFHPGNSCFMPRFPSSIHGHGHGSIHGHGHDRIHQHGHDCIHGAPAKDKEKERNGHDNDDHHHNLELNLASNNGCAPSWILQLTWLLYSIVLPAEFLVAIGYWSFEYEPGGGDNPINLYKHGIIAFLLLWDGNVVGRIPIRIKHWKGLLIYGISYMLWSMMFSYLKMGKRHDGVIYRFMDWRKDPQLAAGIGSMLLFVIGPLVFMASWWLSVLDGCCGCGYGGNRRRVLCGHGAKEEEQFRRLEGAYLGMELEMDDACHDLENGLDADVYSARYGCTCKYGSLDQHETDTLSTNGY